MKYIVLNPFTLDTVLHSEAHGIEFSDVSLTVQADLEQSDINFIVRQFGLTHELPYGMRVPEYADYSDIPNDYHAARQFMMDADSAFMEFPAEVRSRFDNDPGKLLAFIADDANRKEAEKLGIVPPPPSPLPNPADVPVSVSSQVPAASVDSKASGGS